MIFRIQISVLVFVLFTVSSSLTFATSDCNEGENAVRANQFSSAIDFLSKCITNAKINETAKVRALKVRAWAYFKVHENALAVSDQEAAFKIKAPTEYRDFINYSSYLRRVARYKDSLQALRSAEQFDKKSGQDSMMTQYNLGWTLRL